MTQYRSMPATPFAAPTATPSSRPTRHALASAAAASLVALLAASPGARAAALQAIDQSGVSTSGFATGSFDINCTTCGHYVLVMTPDGTPSNGGTGFVESSFNYLGTADRTASAVPNDYTLSGGGSMSASGRLVGAQATPLLGAKAAADNEWVYLTAAPGDPPVGIDNYGLNASAEAIQRYTFTGSTATSYTFNFQVHGVVADERASINGSAQFYAESPEFILASGNSFFQGGLLAPVPPVPVEQSDNFGVTITFNPGESLYLRTSLSAGVNLFYAHTDTFADASSTMLVTSITGGDPNLLMPSLAAAVPEPAHWMLLLSGLAGLGWRQKRQRATA